MIYLVYGDQEMLVNKMSEKLAKEALGNIDEFNYVVLDATKASNDDVMDEISSLPFGSDVKVVNLINSYFLTNVNTECTFDYNELDKYIENETDGVTFIISVTSSKLDEKRNIVKRLKNVAKVVEVNSLNKKDMPRIVRQMLSQRKVEISDSALEELLSRLGTDMYEISNEIDKLATYSNKIHLDDIKVLTPRKLEDNVFDMIEAIFKKNTNKAFRIYNDLKNLGHEAIGLISILSTQVRFLYQILTLSNKGYNEANIANELSVHPYRVKMGLEKVRHYSDYELEDFLDRLSKLDIQIKTGDIDRFVGLELFILSMMN